MLSSNLKRFVYNHKNIDGGKKRQNISLYCGTFDDIKRKRTGTGKLKKNFSHIFFCFYIYKINMRHSLLKKYSMLPSN